MEHIQGSDREQMTLFPEALDDYIARDNPVRFLDVFIDSLDLKSLGFEHVVLKETGRPPYHPADLLKLYVYGYLNRIRSSRRLETESGRNLELMWLLKRLTPDFKTIADFRRDNRRAIRQVCREFTLFCRQPVLPAPGLQAQVARPGKIEAYLDELDANDEKEPEEPTLSAEQLKEKIRKLDSNLGQLRHSL